MLPSSLCFLPAFPLTLSAVILNTESLLCCEYTEPAEVIVR